MNVMEFDIVQVDPKVETFGGCLLVVTSIGKDWLQGYVQAPGQGQAYIRLRFSDVQHTHGHAIWSAE
jgi:hypothetical protein